MLQGQLLWEQFMEMEAPVHSIDPRALHGNAISFVVDEICDEMEFVGGTNGKAQEKDSDDDESPDFR